MLFFVPRQKSKKNCFVDWILLIILFSLLMCVFYVSFQLYHIWHYYRFRQHHPSDDSRKRKLLPVKNDQNICSSNSIKIRYQLDQMPQLQVLINVIINTYDSIFFFNFFFLLIFRLAVFFVIFCLMRKKKCHENDTYTWGNRYIYTT